MPQGCYILYSNSILSETRKSANLDKQAQVINNECLQKHHLNTAIYKLFSRSRLIENHKRENQIDIFLNNVSLHV